MPNNGNNNIKVVLEDKDGNDDKDKVTDAIVVRSGQRVQQPTWLIEEMGTETLMAALEEAFYAMMEAIDKWVYTSFNVNKGYVHTNVGAGIEA